MYTYHVYLDTAAYLHVFRILNMVTELIFLHENYYTEKKFY